MNIIARFASVCPCCSTRIERGSKVEWSRGNPARHLACVTSADDTVALVAVMYSHEDSDGPMVHHFRSVDEAAHWASEGATREAGYTWTSAPKAVRVPAKDAQYLCSFAQPA